ncbi:MAG: galactose-1-phosphate uridylyltransferase, partial [Lachnospiraceae bacterium]|nr:galactose-1-phosphate uridylyltransferase [Lachnospiraceae bacterium]
MRENDCIGEWIIRLAQYGIEKGLLKEDDRIYMENSLADLCGLTELPRILPEEISFPLERILAELLDDVCARGRIEDTVTARDLFDTRLMGLLTPRPSEVRKAFWNAYQKDPKAATDYFYQLSQNSDYIRSYRIKKDRKWTVESPYGVLDITINLSKPEKDPKRIAKLAEQSATLKEHSYPSCQLCLENEGYAGRMDHPARQNLRVIPLSLGGEAWYLQYSPYVYYQEHCIAFCREHRPMKISRESFVRLFDFIDLFPHYFIGSNADLPIVGGSILTHDHFQGGRYEFAMERAEIVT